MLLLELITTLEIKDDDNCFISDDLQSTRLELENLREGVRRTIISSRAQRVKDWAKPLFILNLQKRISLTNVFPLPWTQMVELLLTTRTS